jgi:Flp pilus assembly protein TadB
MNSMRQLDRVDQVLRGFDKALLPYYWLAAVFGTLCFLANVMLNTGWTRLLAVVWVIAVPLWIRRYLQYRRTRAAAAAPESPDQ